MNNSEKELQILKTILNSIVELIRDKNTTISDIKELLEINNFYVEDKGGKCECKPEWLIYETTDTNTFPYGEDYGVYRCNHCNKLHYKVK